MSGIFERLEAKIDQLLALQGQGGIVQQQPSNMGLPAAQALQQQQPVQPQVDPLAFTPPVQQAVTNGMITDLIQPHIGNPAIKAAMQGVLQQLNIPGLPQAREDQYPVLYQHFQAIIAQHTAQPPAQQAGNPGASPLNSGGVSIL